MNYVNRLASFDVAQRQALDLMFKEIYFGAVNQHDHSDKSEGGVLGLSAATLEPTGFENRTSTSLAFSTGTLTFTLGLTGASFTYWLRGKKYVVTAAKTCVITNTNGLWYFWINAAGTLTASQTAWLFNEEKVFVATVYWNGTLGVIGDERHGIAMDWATHEYLHETIGTRYASGLTGTFGDTTFTITAGEIHDEDLDLAITQQTTHRVMYRASGIYQFTAVQTSPYYISGGNVYWDNAGTIQAAASNNYVAYWVFATNDTTVPIKTLMGQRVDTTLANARANNTYESLVFLTLPYAEMKVLYRVLVRNTATPSWIETQDLRSVSNVPAGTFVATSHSSLSGLTADDHLQYLLIDGTRAMTGDLTVPATGKVRLDGTLTTGDTYFVESSANVLDGYAGGVHKLRLTSTYNALFNGDLIIDSGYKLALDGSSVSDTYWIETSANVAELYTGGSKRISQNAEATTFGTGGTGTATPGIVLNGGSGTAGGGYIGFSRNNVAKIYIGAESAILGNASAMGLIYGGDNYIDIWGSGAIRMQIGSTIYCDANTVGEGAGVYNLGTSANYWNDVSYKTLTDRGCLGWFDDGVELQDGTKVSDTEALLAIKKHETKKTIYGVDMMDYKTFPKVAYKKAEVDKQLLPRDEKDEPIGGADGIEMTSMFSIMIGAIKELTIRVKNLEEINKEK